MSIICWTVFYPGGPSVSHGATRLAHAAVRHVRPIVHHSNLMQRHLAKATAQPQRWLKLVCKVIPAALAGGGALLAPPSTMPAQLPAAPPAFIAPGPPVSSVSPPVWTFGPQPPEIRYVGRPPPVISVGSSSAAAPEPGSAVVLLGGVAGLLLLRLSVRRLPYSSDSIQPTACQPKLLRSGPVA
jgi:hypothetical protein